MHSPNITPLRVRYHHHKRSPTIEMRGIARNELLFCAAVLEDEHQHQLNDDDTTLCAVLCPYLRYHKYSRIRKESSKNKKWHQRGSFPWFCNNLSSRQFCRYFRISRDCFNYLCDQIKSNDGEHNFRSEAYLDDLYRGRLVPHPDKGKYGGC